MVKNLVISPHVDDEILGCGGSLHTLKERGEECHVHYCGIDESDAGSGRPSREQRLQELKKVAGFTGFSWSLNEESVVNNYQVRALIVQIEKVINDVKPDKIFIPFPSYNQDHQVAYKSSLVALRPHDRNHFVKKVLVYEQPHVLVWEQKMNVPGYFIPIDVDRKIESYNLYESQIRGMRGFDLIRAMAKLRGSWINQPYAEAFQVYRWVD